MASHSTVPTDQVLERGLPERGSYCVTGAYVITVDEDIGDIPDGHVHISDGELVAVDADSECDRPGERLDGRGRIVIPGFVDTHWHLWNSLLRGLCDFSPERDYFVAKDALAPHYRPIDTYRATRLSLAEALRSGFTTVNNWNHNLRSAADADAGLTAHAEVGLRAKFSYGHPHEQPKDMVLDLDDVLRVAEEWIEPSDGLLNLGMVMRPPNRCAENVYKAEWKFARDHKLSMTFHCSGFRTDSYRYADLMAMDAEGLLGPDVQVVHAVHVNDAEIRMLAGTGTHVSVCPLTQIRSMGGAPPISDHIHAGVLVSFSIDNLANPTPGDMFLQMRGSYSIERLRRPGTEITPRRLLQMATLDGARDLGFDDVAGSLTPGKRADVVVIDANAVNLVPCPDPVAQVVLTAESSNIEYVFVDGRRLLERGTFSHLDTAGVIGSARDSHEYLVSTSGWNWPRGSVPA